MAKLFVIATENIKHNIQNSYLTPIQWISQIEQMNPIVYSIYKLNQYSFRNINLVLKSKWKKRTVQHH